LIDSDGRQIINTFLPEGKPPPRNPLTRWGPVFTERQTIVTDVFTGASSQELLAAVALTWANADAVLNNREAAAVAARNFFTRDLPSKPAL